MELIYESDFGFSFSDSLFLIKLIHENSKKFGNSDTLVNSVVFPLFACFE